MIASLNRRQFLSTAAAGLAASALPYRAHAATSPLTMQAAWINDAEFAGYFLGLDRGYFTDAGLDLEYLSGGPDVIPESTIIAGRADLALTTPDTTIKAITEQGAPFKIIGAQYQKNPIGIVSLAKNPINEPKDLIGKTLAVPPVNVISVEAMLKMNGIDPSQVNIVPYAYDPTPLVKGEIDASLDFTTNVPFTIKQAGEDATSFLLYDFGYTIYNDTVVVTEQVLAEKRDLLVAWLAASRKAWAENLADPSVWPPKFAETHFAGTGRSIENELYFNAAQKPLMESAEGYFALTGDGIEKCLSALGEVGIVGSADMFDTSLLAEI
ncbi:ABC transporter substrate-binding protein [Thalassovita mangrovi]|uniref:Thiamine pyrimidine synthase n=1 Tax=Thalassovita mangrovi TaxID=2692236 RepID=A0A6L8LDY8_9RHOB|nr:ABC transporter substrate-binding protein [Thalassovita mangrovi]MYM54284.1 ABC transporter substrate-binding protein [Thalassovita mangrovi]